MEQHKKKQKVSSKETATICNVFVVAVDGSEGSENALEVVVKDLYRRGLDRIIVVHITNTKKEHEKGIQYHAKTIYNKYSEYLQEHLQESDYELIFEERKENENVFQQVNEMALAKDATLLVLGFRGYKGTKNRPDELSKSVTYLVHKPIIPVLVVKNKSAREAREGGQFKWLICIESAESKSFKALNTMLRYIDADSDVIHGFTVDSEEADLETHPVKLAFEDLMTRNEIRNSLFTRIIREEEQEIKSAVTKWIDHHLRDQNNWFDFIVLGYNPFKYNFNKEAVNATVEILKEVNANVFFDH